MHTTNATSYHLQGKLGHLGPADAMSLSIQCPTIYQTPPLTQSSNFPTNVEQLWHIPGLPYPRGSNDHYYNNRDTTQTITLIGQGLDTRLLTQLPRSNKCEAVYSAPVMQSFYPQVLTQKDASLAADHGSALNLEGEASSSEIREAVKPSDIECPSMPCSSDFDDAIDPAFKLVFAKEVCVGEKLRAHSFAHPSRAQAAARSGRASGSVSPSYSFEFTDGAQCVGDAEPTSEILLTRVYKKRDDCSDAKMQKIVAAVQSSALDHTDSGPGEVLTPFPTSDQNSALTEGFTIHPVSSATTLGPLGGSFQAVGIQYQPSTIFSFQNQSVTQHIPILYFQGPFDAQPISYGISTLGQGPVVQIQQQQLQMQQEQIQQPSPYIQNTRRRAKKMPVPESGNVQKPTTPFYWTREQAELFDQIHHRIGVDRATDKAIWDELRLLVPNITQRNVQSRLQKRRLAIRKYYKLNPKTQLKRHHIHPEFQSGSCYV